MQGESGVEDRYHVWFHKKAWDYAVTWAERSLGRPITMNDVDSFYGMNQRMREILEKAGQSVPAHYQNYPYPKRLPEALAVTRFGRWTRRNVWAQVMSPQGWDECWEDNAEILKLSAAMLARPLLDLQQDMINDGEDPREFPFRGKDPREVFGPAPTPARRGQKK
jgi:hypothetical protein